MLPDLQESIQYVRRCTEDLAFDFAVILGSGLGDVADAAEISGELEYSNIPGFETLDIPGHAGKLLWGTIAGRQVLFFQGRFHLYQGVEVSQVVAPVVLAHGLGCSGILLTNATGSINEAYKPGEVVFVTDHINLSGVNPLTGISPPPFIDLSDLYRRSRYPVLSDALQDAGYLLHHGVLASLPGPSYETPAEIRMLKAAGADLVSMSTVNEAIAAYYLGMSVTALSVVANAAAGLADMSLSHQEVLHVSRQAEMAVKSFLVTLLESTQA